MEASISPTVTRAVAAITSEASGTLSGSRLLIDSQNNDALSKFGGIVQAQLGPFAKGVSTFKLYVDGKLVATKDLTYTLLHR